MKNTELTELNVEQIRHEYKNGITQKVLAEKYSVSVAAISAILLNQRHKNNTYNAKDAKRQHDTSIALTKALSQIDEHKTQASERLSNAKHECDFISQIEKTLNKSNK